MLKYVSKFALDILPSVVATIIGAYIVNHYIATKPGTDAPLAAVVSTPAPGAVKAEPKGSEKASETSAEVASIPEAGVRAKGVSEKAIIEKSADKPAETASIPVDTKRRPAPPREKAVAKVIPAPVPPAAPAVAPVEAAIAPDEHRDANDLARAAIERLRAGDGAARAPEVARAPDAPRSVPDPSHVVVSAPPIRPLPPPIMVSTPETFDSSAGASQVKPPSAADRVDDPRRPTPPADIPASRPLDLRAELAEPTKREHTTVAEDMLLAAKSMFHAVLPK
jgi:hypothetical protein